MRIASLEGFDQRLPTSEEIQRRGETALSRVVGRILQPALTPITERAAQLVAPAVAERVAAEAKPVATATLLTIGGAFLAGIAVVAFALRSREGPKEEAVRRRR